MTALASRRSIALAAGVVAALAAPALAQDLSTPEGAAALVVEACPFTAEALEDPSIDVSIEGPARFASGSREGFRSCELELPGRDAAFLEAMAAELSERLAAIPFEDAETVEDGFIWRWEPAEGLRGEMELSAEPGAPLTVIVALERGELMENSE